MNVKIKLNLRRLLEEKNVTQQQLSAMTGIRQATISEMVNRRRRSVNLDYLERILTVLDVKDPSRLIEFDKEAI